MRVHIRPFGGVQQEVLANHLPEPSSLRMLGDFEKPGFSPSWESQLLLPEISSRVTRCLSQRKTWFLIFSRAAIQPVVDVLQTVGQRVRGHVGRIRIPSPHEHLLSKLAAGQTKTPAAGARGAPKAGGAYSHWSGMRNRRRFSGHRAGRLVGHPVGSFVGSIFNPELRFE